VSIGCLGGAPHRSNGNVLAIAGLPVPAPGRVTSHADAARLLPQCDGAFAAVACADRFVTRHPRAARLLGRGGAKFARSTFLDGPGMNTPDPLLKFDPATRTGLSATAEKLLFHWQAWKHVHSGADWASFPHKARP
jgi:UPF0716 family protein affecting phage T7 exclusion